MTQATSNQLRVPFGCKNGVLVAPGDVIEGGLACGCFCPGCGSSLVLRQGTKRRHFAHHHATGTSHCVESAIHAAAIQVLLEANWLRVPRKFVNAQMATKAGYQHGKSTILSPERVIRFDNSEKEVVLRTSGERIVRADVVGYRKNRRLLIEMCFTHAVDDDKLAILNTLGLPAIEVDLSDLSIDAGFSEVRRRVLEETGQKIWLFYPGEDEARAGLLAKLAQEVAALDDEFDRKQLAKQQQQLAIQERREAKLRSIAAVREKYRALPLADKEADLRQQLRMTGTTWPRHLRIMNGRNDAIDAPLHIWQAGLFHQFIFDKPVGGTTFELDAVVSWINNRYGARPDSALSVEGAVRAFLAYLKGCGFVKRHYNPYGSDYYEVQHNALMPPPRPPTPAVKTIRTPHPSSVSGQRQPQNKLAMQWKSVWPDKATAMNAATKWIRMFRDDYVRMVSYLYDSDIRPESPLIFAKTMEEQNVPGDVTLAFLEEIGLI